MEPQGLAKELKKVFDEKGYQWKFEEGLKTPTEADILDVLQEIMRRLEDQPLGTWYETGRLIFVKDLGLYDVYVHCGSLERQDEQPDT